MIGPGKAFDTEHLLRSVRERAGRLPRHDGAGFAGSGDGQAVRHELSGDHDRRHGAAAAHAGGLAGDPADCWRWRAARWAACRRWSGRCRFPDAVFASHSDRHHGAPQRAADRVQRSGPPGDHGRPGLERRRLLREQPAGARAGGGAHGGPHHLHERRVACARNSAAACAGKEKFSFGFDVDFEVESYLRYRGNQFVGRFDANSYLYITKADGLFRPDQRPPRRWPRRSNAARRGSW